MEHQGRIPPGGKIVLIEDDDHTHVIYGSAEDMKDHKKSLGDSQLSREEQLEEEERRKEVSKAGAVVAPPETPEKRSARKTAAKRKTAKRKTAAKKR